MSINKLFTLYHHWCQLVLFRHKVLQRAHLPRDRLDKLRAFLGIKLVLFRELFQLLINIISSEDEQGSDVLVIDLDLQVKQGERVDVEVGAHSCHLLGALLL